MQAAEEAAEQGSSATLPHVESEGESPTTRRARGPGEARVMERELSPLASPPSPSESPSKRKPRTGQPKMVARPSPASLAASRKAVDPNSRIAQLHKEHSTKLEALSRLQQAPLYDPITNQPYFKPQINPSKGITTKPLYERAVDQEKRKQERLKQVQAEEASVRNSPKLSPATPSLAWTRLERDLRKAFGVAMQYSAHRNPTGPAADASRSPPPKLAMFKQSLARQGLISQSSPSRSPVAPSKSPAADVPSAAVTSTNNSTSTSSSQLQGRESASSYAPELDERALVAFLKVLGLMGDALAQRVIDGVSPLSLDSLLNLFRRAYFSPSTPLEFDLALLLPSRRPSLSSPANLKLTPKPNFAPAITQRSRELDRERIIKMGLDPLGPREALIMREVHLNKQRREHLGMEVTREAMKECTFSPAVTVKARASGPVSERLFKDGQARMERREMERLRRIRETEELAASFSANPRRLSPAKSTAPPPVQPRGFEETVARLAKARLQHDPSAQAKTPPPRVQRDRKGRLVPEPFHFYQPVERTIDEQQQQQQLEQQSSRLATLVLRIRIDDRDCELVVPASADPDELDEAVDNFCAANECWEARDELLAALGVVPAPVQVEDEEAQEKVQLVAEFNVVVSPTRSVRVELYEDDDVDQVCAEFQQQYDIGDEEIQMLKNAMLAEVEARQ